MNAIVEDEPLARQKISHLKSISKKSDARQLHSQAPLIDVLPRLVHKKAAPIPAGSFKRVYQSNEAGAREYHTYDKPTYRTGDGDTIYALRPGALDFKALPSRTGFTS